MSRLLDSSIMYCERFVNPDGTMKEVGGLSDVKGNMIPKERLEVLKSWYKTIFESRFTDDYIRFLLLNGGRSGGRAEYFLKDCEFDYDKAARKAAIVRNKMYKRINDIFESTDFVYEIMRGLETSMSLDQIRCGILKIKRGTDTADNKLYKEKLVFTPKSKPFTNEISEEGFENMIRALKVLSKKHQKLCTDIFNDRYAGYFNYITIVDELNDTEKQRLSRIKEVLEID